MVREFGYEYDAVLDKDIWELTRGRAVYDRLWGALCLRSGRDALKAVAREFAPCTALLPALACDSMVRPFEMYGHKVRFYRLKEDYSLDLNSLEAGEGRTLLLYMDYFGRPAVQDKELDRLRVNGDFVFIEDRTHNLIWDRKSTFQPDYIAASLRKWIPVPDGGLLWGNISSPLGKDLTFSDTRLKAQCMRHEYLTCGDETIKTAYRKIFSEVSDLMESDGPCAMSAYSYALAKKADREELRAVRSRNAGTLMSILETSPCVTFIQDRPGYSDLYVAFTVSNRNEVQRRLSAKGIFNTIIWPLADDQKKVCSVARFTEENMLAAPCDQRYTVEDMKLIGTEIVKVIEDVNQ